ncbi:MAG: hypothetical protein P8183_06335 [Anaerolineae bacterium]
MDKKKRMFVAATLPDDVRTALGQVSEALAAQMPPGSVRWVKPNLLHVTLRFFGGHGRIPTFHHLL